jgi:hypothetical protein
VTFFTAVLERRTTVNEIRMSNMRHQSRIALFSTMLLLVMVIRVNAGDAKTTPTAEPEFYYPTKVGTSWGYRGKDGNELKYVVTAVGDKDRAKIVTVDRMNADGKVEMTSRVKVTEDNVFDLQEEVAIPVPRYRFKLPAKKGDVFEKNGIYPGGVPVKWKDEVGGKERIKVPAGTFDAVRIKETMMINNAGDLVVVGSDTSWYAPGVGIVRVASEKGVEYELTHFKKAEKK